jgi:hypothetical protein
MSEQEEDPCKELLKRFETERLTATEHDISEVVTVLSIVVLYVLCVVLSVAVDLATAIEAVPAIGMVTYHKRDAVKTVARKIPAKARKTGRQGDDR